MMNLLKRFNCSWIKRILSLCLALAMVFALLPAMSNSADALAAGDTVYLKPNSNWTQAGARFAIYYFGAGEKWVDMTDSDGDGVYESVIPTGGYSSMIFCRMNPSATANNWSNKWNQTADLTVPTDGTNLYTVKAGTWDQGGGTWSTFEGVVEPEPELTPPAAGTTLYFKPGSQWGSDAARYAAYFFDSNNNAVWVDLTDTDGDGYFEVVIPAGGYTTVIFCRMDGTILENSWDAKFNQTLDLPLDENYNCFTMDDATQWETSADGTWSVYTPSGSGGNEGGEGGETTPAEYCLVGFINGADDGNGDDYASTNHKFVNGSLTMTFTETSYVFVKTTDNANWYMTQTFTQGTTATLYNTSTGAMEKMQVPAGEVTFTLVVNADGTLTLSYTVAGGGNTGGDTSASDYYLFGYIDRADYGVGDDYATLGKYGFDENGKLTTSFVADSYVGVKSADLSCWYQTDGWKGSVTSATLIDSNYFPNVNVNTLDKLFVPGGVEITFTLTVNNDHTVTLSYEADTLKIEDTSGIQDGVTLHAWNWSFAEIEANMATIAAQGYTAIQTSPIQPAKEATNLSTNNVEDHWWVYYQPVDFVINTDSGNALGTKTELESMIETAHKYGIKVIVDVVANHLGNNTGNDLADAIPEYLRNNAYWHDITQNTSQDDYDDGNRTGITQKCMGGLPDLNTANKELQNIILNFLKECIDAGVDGFRFDATKHIEAPTDDASIASDFWPTVVDGAEAYAKETRSIDLYCYGEVLDEPGGMLPISAYTPYVAVTDNSWGNTVRGNVAGGTASINAGYNKVVDPAQLVIWAESHDTYADGSSSGVSTANINKTWALVAARADAMGLYLARPASMTQALGVASVTGWANGEVKAVNQFHNAFASTGEAISVSGNIIYIERGDAGVVLVNVGGTSATVSVAAKAMADGTYTDQITGNTFTVSNGTISGSIGATGIAVVYNAATTSCEHTNTETATVDATCTTDGSVTVTCSDCGSVVSYETIPATGHNAVDGVCTVCGETTEMTIYFQNNWMWSDICLYYWYADGSWDYAWPGAPMEFYANDGNYDVYKLTIPTDVAGFIINGVKDDGTDTRDQTPNIESGWYDGICYYMLWDDGNTTGSEDIDVIVPPTCAHANTTTTTVDATCTTDGSVTVTCDDCGKTLTSEVIKSNGHDYTYTNNGENHTVGCNNCDYSVTEGHTYENGACICGATETVIPTDPTQADIKISHTVSFDSDLKMNYRIKYSNIAAAIPNYVTEGAYLVVEKDQYLASGEFAVDTVTLYPDLESDPSRMLFNLGGIQSVEMGSELRAVLHIFDADGKEYVTPVDAYSVLDYAQLFYDTYTYQQQPELYAMLIDALNYGSAAQIYFGRRADVLVNAGMEAYQQYATTELSAPLEDSKVTETNDRTITAVSKIGFSVTFADKTEMNAKLTIASGYSKSDITCVKVLDAEGKVVDTLTDFVELADGRLQVTYYGVKSVQMRDRFYFVAYVGDQVASDNVGYSVEAYAKGNVGSSNTALANMVLNCIYYGDSAYAYFNR